MTVSCQRRSYNPNGVTTVIGDSPGKKNGRPLFRECENLGAYARMSRFTMLQVHASRAVATYTLSMRVINCDETR